MKKRNIYLIRHGRSEGNEDSSTYYTKKDCFIDLTGQGVMQSKLVGDYFGEWSNNKWEDATIFSSPYVRSMQTMAHALGPHYKCPVVVDYRIREQSMGTPTGRGDVEVFWEEYIKDPIYFTNTGRDSSLSVFDRIHSFLDSINKFDSINLIIFTHGHVINVITSIIQNVPLHEHIKKGYVYNGSVTKLEAYL